MRRSAAIIALSAGITTGCDFDRKVGGMMLVAAPLVYLLGLAAIRALWQQWRKVRPELEFDGGLLHGGVVALLIAVAVWGARINVPALGVLLAPCYLRGGRRSLAARAAYVACRLRLHCRHRA